MGLEGYRNTSYPEGLRALLDGTPARYAVIDTGTNSVKLHVAEVAPDGGWRTVADRAEITRLGEGLAATGVIAAAALDRTADAIGGMASEARCGGCRSRSSRWARPACAWPATGRRGHGGDPGADGRRHRGHQR